MNYLKSTLKAAMVVLPLFAAQSLMAQKIAQKSTSINVSGTSPMHDWTMSSTTSTFTGEVSDNTIKSVTFSVPVKSLTSTKGKMMNNKAYSALKSDKAPNITFTTASMPVGSGNATGKLSIAGVAKNVSIPVSVVKKGDSYVISASKAIKLSEFGMEKPGFMGIKTGDDVTVKVNVVAE